MVSVYVDLAITPGSFKIRGVFTQLTSLVQELQGRSQHLVASSAGNYGKAFAYMAQDLGLNTTVVMPYQAPKDRVEIIKVAVTWGHFY